MEFLKGKRTYLISALTILYAVLGLVLGYQSPDIAIPLILGALSVAGLRAGVSEKK